MKKTILTVWCACVPLACSPGQSSDPDGFTVRDSAGVTIVENQAPAWSGDEVWTVDPAPSLRIGELDGPPETSFGNVRAVGWLADGRIFVGDEQAHTIRVFSPEGEYVASAGREGQGPGELQWFLNVAPYRQDSLFVYDYANRAVSIFGPDLSFARRFNNPLTEGNYWVRGPLDDGRFLTYSPGSSRLEGGPGLVADSSLILLSAPDGSSADTIAAFEVGVRLVDLNGRPQPQYLVATPAIAVIDGGITWTKGDRFEYVDADTDGTIVRIVRKSHEPVPVTSQVIADFGNYYVDFLARESPEANPAMLERVQESLDEAEYPPTLPPTSYELRTDPLGNRWVGRYEFVGTPTDTWDVFDSRGIWLGTVQTPEGVEVHQIEGDAIIGVSKDEFGVAYVQVHSLERGDRSDM